MIALATDVMVYTREQFEQLPEDGAFEVVDGRAILVAGNFAAHQKLSMAVYDAFRGQLGGDGFVLPAMNVFIPRPPRAIGEIQNRIPDLVVCRRIPKKLFEAGDPPELVIEVLSTPRGNVEYTEKMDDYARAGVPEYWIFDPFRPAVDVFYLVNGEYVQQPRDADAPLRPIAFPTVVIQPRDIFTD